MMRVIHGPPFFRYCVECPKVSYSIPDCLHSVLQRVLSGALGSWPFGRIPTLLRMRAAAGFQSVEMLRGEEVLGFESGP